MLTKRLAFFFGISLFVAAIAACGDDNKGDDGTTPDAPCVGHLCGGPVALTDPEGGNILFEYIYFDTQLQALLGVPATAQRVMAYFMNAQTPNANPLPTPGACTNLVTTKGWPGYVGTPHTDLDVGALTFEGKKNDGGASTITAAKQPAGKDQIGRAHDIFYQVVTPNADTVLKPDSLYTVKFGGAGTIMPTEFKDNIFLANTFNVSDPGLEDDGPLRANADFTVHWTPATSANLPSGDEVLGITWLLTNMAEPVMLCPVLHSAGQFTIPKAVIADFRATATAMGRDPNVAVLLRNAVVHKLARLPNNDMQNKRRIDCLSVMCWAQVVNTSAN
jgi:hypothetical protein